MARASSLSVAASTTDGALISARAGKQVLITSLLVAPGASTTVTINSKGAGAGTALSPGFASFTALPQNTDGWFISNTGEGVTVTTSAGAASAVTLFYVWVTP